MKITFEKIHLSLLSLLQFNQPVPVDKLVLIPYMLGLPYLRGVGYKGIDKFVLTLLVCVAGMSFIMNFPNASIQIFYPIFFLAAAILTTYTELDLLTLRKILFINVFIGFLATVASYCGIENELSFSLREKMLPYVYGPYGVSPTQQVYGTFCILLQLISFQYKKTDWMFYLSLLCMFSTLNRCTLLFFGILLFLYRRKLFLSLCVGALLLVIRFWDTLSKVLFSTSTLDSRSDLRKGVEISFWESHDLLVYLFGKGNTNTTESIAAKTYWGRTYIEHGLDFLVHSYGFIGLSVIFCIMAGFLISLTYKKKYGYALISFYYLMVEPFFTHEFLSSSFFYFVIVIICLSRENDENSTLQPGTASV